ncbi:MAG TPA: ribonuclease HII [Candidatus Nitrosotenuis sp.]|nr:ribonuclease HII [Candidatus Nitrosotenuis sp.]HIH45778.1 ribonuclease HII [Candidatus Nitrosotenuis sp.]HIH68530.1 ribonuclease HII [Candidatus Nitrosotenuis sp.]HII03991.1 ribonuclease HII [Candidatus Nitrosotenuis sp.]
MLVCGVDEAGRGSMIGPLVVAAITIEKSKIKKLSEIGVKDSKKLSPKTRDVMYKQIIKIVDNYAISKASPRQIDLAVAKHNLNNLESLHMARVIEKLQPSVSFVDSCDVNATRFGKEIAKMCHSKVQAYHHADSKFVVVSAASIIAKVTRDREIAKISKKNPVGSGYPSDSKTISFVKDWFAKNGQLPKFVRKSWAPAKLIVSQSLT